MTGIYTEILTRLFQNFIGNQILIFFTSMFFAITFIPNILLAESGSKSRRKTESDKVREKKKRKEIVQTDSVLNHELSFIESERNNI